MRALEELVQKQGCQASIANQQALKKYCLSPGASPLMQRELKNQKTRTQHMKKRQNRFLHEGKRASVQQNCPQLIPTDLYLQNATKLAPDEQIQILQKRVKQLWNQVRKKEENQKYFQDALQDSVSRNVHYYQRDKSEQSNRVATASEGRNRSRHESHGGDLSQNSKMLIAMGSVKDVGLQEVHGPEKIQISFQTQDSRETKKTSNVNYDDREDTKIDEIHQLIKNNKIHSQNSMASCRIEGAGAKHKQKYNPISQFVSQMRLEPLETQEYPSQHIQQAGYSLETETKQKVFLNILNKQPQTAVFPFTPINSGRKKQKQGKEMQHLPGGHNGFQSNQYSLSPRGLQMKG